MARCWIRIYARNFKAGKVKRGRRARRARSKFISHHRTDCSSRSKFVLSLSLGGILVPKRTGTVSVRIKRKLVRVTGTTRSSRCFNAPIFEGVVSSRRCFFLYGFTGIEYNRVKRRREGENPTRSSRERGCKVRRSMDRRKDDGEGKSAIKSEARWPRNLVSSWKNTFANDLNSPRPRRTELSLTRDASGEKRRRRRRRVRIGLSVFSPPPLPPSAPFFPFPRKGGMTR